MMRSANILAALGLAAAPLPLAAQEAQQVAPALSLEHRMLLRCSAAVAMVAYGQENGNPAALEFPPMAERGQEFFVRASARVMDEAGLDREQVSTALDSEARDLMANETLEDVMPVCLGVMRDMWL